MSKVVTIYTSVLPDPTPAMWRVRVSGQDHLFATQEEAIDFARISGAREIWAPTVAADGDPYITVSTRKP